MRIRNISISACWLAVVLGLAASADAQFAHQPQDHGQDQDGGSGLTASAPKKRGLRWWERSRPAKTNAAEQLAYANQLLEEDRLRAAARHYRILTYAWPNAPEAPTAQFQYAGILHKRGRYAKAFDEYQYLLDTYAGFFPYDQVLEEQYAIADQVATRKKRLLFIPYQDEAEAVPMFEQLLINAPRWPRAPEIQFRTARIYENQKEYDAAIDAYAAFQQKYPTAPQAELAFFGHARCWHEYSRRFPNDASLREHALAAQRLFLNTYPRSAMAPTARIYQQELLISQSGLLYDQACMYDRMAGHTRIPAEQDRLITAAIINYRRVIREFPESHWAKMAGARLGPLEQRQAASATEK